MRELEEWRPIRGFEGSYSVSTHGRVRSHDRVVVRSDGVRVRRYGKVLRPFDQGNGYPKVGLCKDGNRVEEFVHRLVVKSFVGDPGGNHVNHKDGCKSNNYIDNLEILSPRENFRHAMETGLWDYRGSKHPWSKLSESDVRVIRKLYESSRYMTQERIAGMFGMDTSNVHYVVSRKSWNHVDEGVPLCTFRGESEGSPEVFLDDLLETEIVYSTLPLRGAVPVYGIHLIVPGDVVFLEIELPEVGGVFVPQVGVKVGARSLRPLPDEDAELYEIRSAVTHAVLTLGAEGIYGVSPSVIPSVSDDERFQQFVLSISGDLYRACRSGATPKDDQPTFKESTTC